MIEIIIIIVVAILFYFMSRPKKVDIYEMAYELGVTFLDTIGYSANYVVMFDIDDTLIFSKNGKPIKPIIRLIKECNKRNIQVLILTARDSMFRDETIYELAKNGIYPDNEHDIPRNGVHYEYLYLRHNPTENHEFFKSKVKENFAKNGLYTIMSVGDNVIDVIGDYSGYCIKLPNVRKDDPRFDPRLFHKDNCGNMVHVKI